MRLVGLLDLVVIREKEKAWAEEIKIPLGGVAENLWSPQAPTPPARTLSGGAAFLLVFSGKCNPVCALGVRGL